MAINLHPNAALNGPDVLTRSLDRLARDTTPPSLADALTLSPNLDAQRRQAQTDLADVQNAVTAAQSNDSRLAQVSDLVSQMSDLVEKSAPVPFQPQFKALQVQLGATLGTAAPVGGTPTSASAQKLVAQDGAGAFTLTLASPEVGDVLDAAAQEAALNRATLADGLAKLNHRAASLRVEHANLNATMPNLQTAEDAAAATQLAKSALFAAPGSALSAQGTGRTPAAAFKLLED